MAFCFIGRKPRTACLVPDCCGVDAEELGEDGMGSSCNWDDMGRFDLELFFNSYRCWTALNSALLLLGVEAVVSVVAFLATGGGKGRHLTPPFGGFLLGSELLVSGLMS